MNTIQNNCEPGRIAYNPGEPVKTTETEGEPENDKPGRATENERRPGENTENKCELLRIGGNHFTYMTSTSTQSKSVLVFL